MLTLGIGNTPGRERRLGIEEKACTLGMSILARSTGSRFIRRRCLESLDYPRFLRARLHSSKVALVERCAMPCGRR